MLFIFGAGLGALDVAMNAHGALIQNLSGKPIMSSLHGLFSVGGLIGPLLIGALIKTGLSAANSAMIMSAGLLIITFIQQSSLLKQEDENKIAHGQSHEPDQPTGQKVAWLNRTVLFLGAMCFIAFLTEGAVLDWGALLLHDSRGMDKALSGLGYAFFSVAMAIMRLSGDKIVSRFSSQTVVLTGSIIAFLGYCFILFASWIPATLFGFALIGIGAANIVPVFFSAAGSMKNVSGASAISMIGTIGYVGQLAGPAILGFLAQHLSLPIALFMSGLLLLVAGIAYRISGIKTQ
jgi:fucose permease